MILRNHREFLCSINDILIYADLFRLENVTFSSFVDNFSIALLVWSYVLVCIVYQQLHFLVWTISVTYILFLFFFWKSYSDIKINLLKFTKCVIGARKLVPLTLACTDRTGDWNAMRNWYSLGRFSLSFYLSLVFMW